MKKIVTPLLMALAALSPVSALADLLVGPQDRLDLQVSQVRQPGGTSSYRMSVVTSVDGQVKRLAQNCPTRRECETHRRALLDAKRGLWGEQKLSINLDEEQLTATVVERMDFAALPRMRISSLKAGSVLRVTGGGLLTAHDYATNPIRCQIHAGATNKDSYAIRPSVALKLGSAPRIIAKQESGAPLDEILLDIEHPTVHQVSCKTLFHRIATIQELTQAFGGDIEVYLPQDQVITSEVRDPRESERTEPRDSDRRTCLLYTSDAADE